MNTGMQDSINLAWKLALVVREEASDALLDSYSPERSAVGDAVLRNASLLTDAATLSNPAAQSVRNIAVHFMLALHAVQDRMATTMSETDIAYVSGPLSTGRHAGRRVHPSLYNGPPPGAGAKPRWVLYAADAEQGAAFAARFSTLLETPPRSPPHPADLLIVRPDGYIGLSATDGQWSKAECYLRQFL